MSQSSQSPDDTEPDTTPAEKWTRSSRVEPGSPVFKYLTETAGIAPGIIDAAGQTDGLREGPNGTAWFAHRSIDGTVTGVNGEGPDFKVMLKGSRKTLYRLPGSDNTSRVVLTERPLETLAVAQIEKLRPDTLYVGTGGALSQGSLEALKAELARIKDLPDAELAVATGRSTEGAFIAVQGRKLAEEIGLRTIRHTPPNRSFNWHTYLKENPNTESLTSQASVESKPGAEAVLATGAQPNAAPATPKKDPLADLLEQLKLAASRSDHDEMDKIRQRIDQLLEAQQNPDISMQPVYRMRVAWALMDVEKFSGSRIQIGEDLRKDLAVRGTTMPDLTNPDVGSLLAATKNIPEQKLVQDIRDLAAFVAAQPSPQITTEILQKASQMKDRVIGALINMGGQDTKTQQIESKTSRATASANQTAQDARQTTQEATQKVTADEDKVSRNRAAAQTTRNEKGQTAEVPTGGNVVVTVRRKGDLLQSLTNIARAWHDVTYGPNSSTARRHAEKVAEAAAKGEPPPPAPYIPPAPSFTTGTRTNDPEPAPSTPVSSVPPADKPAPSPTSYPPKKLDAGKDGTFGFGASRPDNGQILRTDAPANWPKTPDQEIDAVIGSLHTTTQDRIDAATARAANSAMAAASAVKDLVEGPGRDIVARITSAARVEGGDTQAVISEMRPGGKYASLREDFDTSLQKNPALAAAVNRAVTELNAYGEDRGKLEATHRRLERDPEDAEKKFQSVDETLAKAAQAFPGDTPGTAMIENLSEKIREALRRVVATVRQIIGLDPGPASQPRQDNSPGMGM